jgi:RsmE family RNA methyltransferase
MNLILLEAAEISISGDVTLDDARGVHLTRVLKVGAGQQIRVGLLDGAIGTGTVTDVRDRGVTLRCEFNAPRPSRPRVDLLLALPRPKVMRRLWPQLAAIGVGQIILTNAERVERDYFDTHVLSAETYGPLLIEGLQQARDTRLPLVSIHRRFRVLVEDPLDGLVGGGVRIVADPRQTQSVDAVIGGGDGRVLLAIGPEGGWNEFELRLLHAHGFHAAGMGPRTLRVDTACIALLAVVHSALDATSAGSSSSSRTRQ